MAADPLNAMGRWRAGEGAIEITVPLVAVGVSWAMSFRYLSAPAVGRGVTWVELAVILGACCAVTGWMAGRQMYMAGKRKPWTLVTVSIIYAGIITAAVSQMVGGSFESACTEQLSGTLVDSMVLAGAKMGEILPEGPRLCRIGGVRDNPYLPGTLLRATWDGSLHPLLVVFLAMVAPLSALGTRDRRVSASKIGDRLMSMLRFAPGKGSLSSVDGVGADGKVVACANATLWGELCGQMYSSDRVFQTSEWCTRCHQVFRPCRRELRFKVVTLFSAEIDVLNGLERVDTLAWGFGEPIPPDARISGEERWVHLGDIEVPDVITVAQLLSLVHERLAQWKGSENPRIAAAANLAMKRASRIAAWIWFGTLAHRLTYARPNDHAQLMLGSTRLRDVVTEAGEELWLQLDTGFLPIEVRVGYRKEREDGQVMRENNKVDLWIPTSPPHAPKDAQGVWVPRIEGDAFRLWLSTERLREGDREGMSEPAPYYAYEGRGEEVPEQARVRPGTLDFARVSFGDQGREPSMAFAPGASLSEWDWMEAPQIQLLRQHCVVLVEGGR